MDWNLLRLCCESCRIYQRRPQISEKLWHENAKSYWHKSTRPCRTKFTYYYWTCDIQKMLLWTEECSPVRCKLWVQIKYMSSPFHLGAVLCASFSPSQFSSNPVFLNSIRIWSQFRKHFGLHTTLIRSPFKISVLNNSIRNISLQDVRRQWEGELGEEVTEDQWETAPNLVHTSSQS